MSNEVLTKIAELSSYLDERGHKEESHALDHKLMRIAQPKVLNIDGVDYPSAEAAWRAYDGNKNYQSFVSALKLNRPDSQGIKAALYNYFGSAAPEMPGQAVPQPGASKEVDEPKWYDPRDWPGYIEKMRPEARDMPPHIEKRLEGADLDN